ncbi:MAG: hypothetical protein R3B95_09040 [Nitrospirales bacterium]|nr:hypothetical protein [Nitrospirales bacterium]
MPKAGFETSPASHPSGRQILKFAYLIDGIDLVYPIHIIKVSLMGRFHARGLLDGY